MDTVCCSIHTYIVVSLPVQYTYVFRRYSAVKDPSIQLSLTRANRDALLVVEYQLCFDHCTCRFATALVCSVRSREEAATEPGSGGTAGEDQRVSYDVIVVSIYSSTYVYIHLRT